MTPQSTKPANTGHESTGPPPPLSLVETCRKLRDTLDDYLSGRVATPMSSARRETLLADARHRVTARIRSDLVYNIDRLRSLADEVGAGTGRQAYGGTIIENLFERLEAGRQLVESTDAYVDGPTEEKCWLAVQQFYGDALELADRLLGRGRVPDRIRSVGWRHGKPPRRNFLGITGYTWPQTLLRAVEVAVPHPFRMRFWATMAPTVGQLLWHQVVPWGRLRWEDFERSTLGWLGDDGLSRLRGGAGRVVRYVGRDALEQNETLFSPKTGKARANVIFAGSHRIGFLDFPFFALVLDKLPHFVWANNAFYGPGMGKKLERERTTLPVRGQGKLELYDAIRRSIELFTSDRLSMFLMADGSQPNMMYGNQMRVKRGIRLLVDECVRQTAPHGRRTFVVPLTFNDPVAYIQRRDNEITVTAHRPIEIVEPSSRRPRESVFDPSRINGGDDLLNHLEALYMINSMMVRHEIHTPCVVTAARRRHRRLHTTGPLRPGAIRRWLADRFYTPVCEMTEMLNGHPVR